VNQSDDPTPITLARNRELLVGINRDLLVGMVVTMVMLAAAIVFERIEGAEGAQHFQSTLSNYYYTTAHSIFIAALLVLSTLFFVYKGSSNTEDELLTLAGICTLTAALVPRDAPIGELTSPPDLPSNYDPRLAIEPNVWAVVVALGLGWLAMRLLHRRTLTKPIRSPGGTLSLYILRLVVGLGLIALCRFPAKFKEYAHGAAGVLMLLSFIATVFCAAYVVGQEDDSKSPKRLRYRRFYRVIAVGMLVTLVAVVTVHLVHPGWVFWIILMEATLILEFAAYGAVKTLDLWDTPDPMERLSDQTRHRLAERRAKRKRGLSGLKSELANARKEPPGQRLLPLL